MSEEFFEQLEQFQEEDEENELNFDGIAIQELTPKMKLKLEGFATVTCLSLNNCELKTLNNLPNLPELNRIELMGNQFPASELSNLLIYKNLECVSIGDNQIDSIEDLKQFA